MTNLLDGAAVGVVDDSDANQTLHKCEWKNCQKTHTKKPSYPGNGDVARNSSYASDWVAANLEPWKKYGPGTDTRAKRSDYLAETPGAAYVATASSLKHPEYHTQKHHLLSVKLFGKVADLSHNAKLAGYDVNHQNNGVCLPSYVVDIARHDLQCHRGNHPNGLYYDNLDPLLADLEVRSLNYCVADSSGDATPQLALVGAIDRLSLRTEGQLRNWKWLLRSDAVQERVQSKARLKALPPPSGG
jgi:A nuclease family of the HNH/ENDO VII superfamily with conserved AHH